MFVVANSHQMSLLTAAGPLDRGITDIHQKKVAQSFLRPSGVTTKTDFAGVQDFCLTVPLQQQRPVAVDPDIAPG